MNVYTDRLLESAFQAHRRGAAAQAEVVLRMLVGTSAHDGHTLYFLGHLHYLRGRLDDAVWFLRRAIAIDPGHARAHNDLGEALRALGHNREALPLLQRAIALEPSLAHAYGNLAATLVALNRPEEALGWAQQSLRRIADKAVAHCDLGSVFGRLNRAREAIRQYDLALQLQPRNARARYFKGMMRLALGQMPDAWADHEARLDLPPAMTSARVSPEPRWTGEQDLRGRTILLHAEQGLGDSIQFVRYVPMVAARGATVLLLVQPGLRRLFNTLAGMSSVFEPGDHLPDFDLQCSLMSLPAVFATCLETIPASVPYLSADPALSEAWSAHLGPRRKMRVGLAWSGRVQHAADTERSLPLQLLSGLLDRGDVAWHVVQRDISDSDRAATESFPGLTDHSPALTDFSDTAALFTQLDLVITVDTAVAHLAGALNVPAWVMLAHAADWRWMRDRADSPWYPSLRLFRQQRRGDWLGVVHQISASLDAWMLRRGATRIRKG